MSFDVFFLYDTHCPWSYRASELINNIISANPTANLHLFHCAFFDGNQKIASQQLLSVTENSNYQFTAAYTANNYCNSIPAANLMAWCTSKSPQHSLPLLNKLFNKHFELGNPIDEENDLESICNELKLSPPKKVIASQKLTKSAEAALYEINEIQDFIGTEAIPAILIAVGDKLTLLNHNLYLMSPEKIIEAVELELNN